MSDTLLSIVIEPHFVAAVVTLNNQDVIEVVQSVSTERSSSLSAALNSLIEQLDQPPSQALVSIGSDKIGYHSLSFPFQDKMKIAEILPFELEETTSHKLDDHLFDYHLVKEENNGKKKRFS